MTGTCLCGSDAVAKGLCNTCYQRNRRAHPTITVKIPIDGEMAMAAAAAGMSPKAFISAVMTRELDAIAKRKGVA